MVECWHTVGRRERLHFVSLSTPQKVLQTGESGCKLDPGGPFCAHFFFFFSFTGSSAFRVEYMGTVAVTNTEINNNDFLRVGKG